MTNRGFTFDLQNFDIYQSIKGYIFIPSFSGEGVGKFVRGTLVCLLNYNIVNLS